MDIATTLLEFGARPDAESKVTYTCGFKIFHSDFWLLKSFNCIHEKKKLIKKEKICYCFVEWFHSAAFGSTGRSHRHGVSAAGAQSRRQR
jgi:hypothetical protein